MSDEEDKESVYHTGSGQSDRINKICADINDCRMNFDNVNENFGKFGWEIMTYCIDSLFMEVHPKCSITEKIEGNRMKNVVKEWPILYPPRSFRNNRWLNNPVNLSGLKEVIESYEKMIKSYLEKHNLLGPSLSGSITREIN